MAWCDSTFTSHSKNSFIHGHINCLKWHWLSKKFSSTIHANVWAQIKFGRTDEVLVSYSYQLNFEPCIWETGDEEVNPWSVKIYHITLGHNWISLHVCETDYQANATRTTLLRISDNLCVYETDYAKWKDALLMTCEWSWKDTLLIWHASDQHAREQKLKLLQFASESLSESHPCPTVLNAVEMQGLNYPGKNCAIVIKYSWWKGC
jgi:hypothetical protein